MGVDSDFMDNLVKFNSSASGRDKLFRLVQYCTKFSWWYLEKAGVHAEAIARLQKLSSSLSTTRKFLRLGKSVDFMHGALRSIHLTDSVLRYTITLSKLNQAVYLLFDHIIWAGRVGLAMIDKDKWSKLSAQFWIVTLILNLVRDIYEICIVLSSELKARTERSSRSLYKNGLSDHKTASKPILTNSQLVKKCVEENKPLFLDLVKNLSDLVLPLEALGHVKASPGVQGLVGTISSVIGVWQSWNPLLRLVPS
ncbi:peroxisomal membrane protein 11B [Aplysia californica]|uniref:Peroxisomal membrane protein 11B n=1 Tax=Aplysia californica TaxID=6500 RepID=A0ABM0JHZ5_APLCA|nr:peroxisomal membrane protein 11B [Aplysia californica]XP_005094068.1 peroxisomal membrane protein 11B [Aplysia californica]